MRGYIYRPLTNDYVFGAAGVAELVRRASMPKDKADAEDVDHQRKLRGRHKCDLSWCADCRGDE